LLIELLAVASGMIAWHPLTQEAGVEASDHPAVALPYFCLSA